jgi:hypothetical protein
MLLTMHLLASTKRQTHARSFSVSKRTGVVGLNLRRAARIGQIAVVVHYVTIGNVVLGDGCTIILDTARYCDIRAGDGSSSTKREIQRHFIIILNILFLTIFIFNYFYF